MQQTSSQRLLSWRRASRESSATKAVIWRIKSMSTARAAYSANVLTAGMVDRAPGSSGRGGGGGRKGTSEIYVLSREGTLGVRGSVLVGY